MSRSQPTRNLSLNGAIEGAEMVTSEYIFFFVLLRAFTIGLAPAGDVAAPQHLFRCEHGQVLPVAVPLPRGCRPPPLLRVRALQAVREELQKFGALLPRVGEESSRSASAQLREYERYFACAVGGSVADARSAAERA